MRIGQRGFNLIRNFEQLRLRAYDDKTGREVRPGGRVLGKLTIGWGHTGADVFRGQEITPADADNLLMRDLAIAEGAVNSLVDVALTQNQYDALVSLVFNWGMGNFSQSVLLQRLNAGDYAGAAARLREHPVTSGGQVMPGLITRRGVEADLFLDGAGISPNPSKPLATKQTRKKKPAAK